jgi:hypothetical protein
MMQDQDYGGESQGQGRGDAGIEEEILHGRLLAPAEAGADGVRIEKRF